MALIIRQQPSSRTPAYNEQWVTAESNMVSTHADFYYIVETFVNTNLISTDNVFPRPDGFLKFNAKEKVKNYIKHPFNPLETGLVEATDKAVLVEMNIREYYSSAIQSTESLSYVAFDACLNEIDFSNYDAVDYTTLPILLGYQQLNKVDSVVAYGNDVFLHFFGNDMQYINIDDGTNATNINMPSGYNTDLIYTLNVGYNKLLDLGFNYSVGTTVTVTLYTASQPPVSLSYTISDICTKYEPLTIYYMDRAGRIQFKQFELMSQKKATKKTNEVRLAKSYLNSSGQVISNIWDRETFEVSNLTTYTKMVNSNWITETQSELLNELFDSPFVWIRENSQYIPVKVTDTSYDFKKHINERLFNISLNLEYSVTETRQRAL